MNQSNVIYELCYEPIMLIAHLVKVKYAQNPLAKPIKWVWMPETKTF